MSDNDVLELGGPDRWYDYYGGFTPDRSRDGRRVVDHEIDTRYVGMTANAYEPGEQAGYWHTHSQIEELYVFLVGRTKRDAELFLASVTMSKATGEQVDPSRAKVTVGMLGPKWLTLKRNLKPSYVATIERDWRVYVEPAWATRTVGSIRPSEVAE